MNKHRRLIILVFISMTFATFVACDADQQSNAAEVASEAPSSSDAGTTSYTQKLAETVDASIAGKYVSPDNPEAYLQLNADGTYVLAHNRRRENGGQPYSGQFTIKGDQIRLQLTEKQSTMLQFVDGAVVNRQGIRWEKE